MADDITALAWYILLPLVLQGRHLSEMIASSTIRSYSQHTFLIIIAIVITMCISNSIKQIGSK